MIQQTQQDPYAAFIRQSGINTSKHGNGEKADEQWSGRATKSNVQSQSKSRQRTIRKNNKSKIKLREHRSEMMTGADQDFAEKWCGNGFFVCVNEVQVCV